MIVLAYDDQMKKIILAALVVALGSQAGINHQETHLTKVQGVVVDQRIEKDVSFLVKTYGVKPVRGFSKMNPYSDHALGLSIDVVGNTAKLRAEAKDNFVVVTHSTHTHIAWKHSKATTKGFAKWVKTLK